MLNPRMFISLITVALVTIPTYAKAIDLDLSAPDESALTLFTDSDWAILRSRAKQALNNDTDGTSSNWINNQTGHTGQITPLSTATDNELICRNTQFINIAGDTSSTTLVNLCKKDGKWFEESSRETTTVKLNTTTEQPQSVLHSPSLQQEPVISKKVISRTSEHCRQLFQNIENLKGKPQRRSAAIDLHKAECLN